MGYLRRFTRALHGASLDNALVKRLSVRSRRSGGDEHRRRHKISGMIKLSRRDVSSPQQNCWGIGWCGDVAKFRMER